MPGDAGLPRFEVGYFDGEYNVCRFYGTPISPTSVCLTTGAYTLSPPPSPPAFLIRRPPSPPPPSPPPPAPPPPTTSIGIYDSGCGKQLLYVNNTDVNSVGSCPVASYGCPSAEPRLLYISPSGTSPSNDRYAPAAAFSPLTLIVDPAITGVSMHTWAGGTWHWLSLRFPTIPNLLYQFADDTSLLEDGALGLTGDSDNMHLIAADGSLVDKYCDAPPPSPPPPSPPPPSPPPSPPPALPPWTDDWFTAQDPSQTCTEVCDSYGLKCDEADAKTNPDALQYLDQGHQQLVDAINKATENRDALFDPDLALACALDDTITSTENAAFPIFRAIVNSEGCYRSIKNSGGEYPYSCDAVNPFPEALQRYRVCWCVNAARPPSTSSPATAASFSAADAATASVSSAFAAALSAAALAAPSIAPPPSPPPPSPPPPSHPPYVPGH